MLPKTIKLFIDTYTNFVNFFITSLVNNKEQKKNLLYLKNILIKMLHPTILNA